MDTIHLVIQLGPKLTEHAAIGITRPFVEALRKEYGNKFDVDSFKLAWSHPYQRGAADCEEISVVVKVPPSVQLREMYLTCVAEYNDLRFRLGDRGMSMLFSALGRVGDNWRSLTPKEESWKETQGLSLR